MTEETHVTLHVDDLPSMNHDQRDYEIWRLQQVKSSSFVKNEVRRFWTGLWDAPGIHDAPRPAVPIIVERSWNGEKWVDLTYPNPQPTLSASPIPPCGMPSCESC